MHPSDHNAATEQQKISLGKAISISVELGLIAAVLLLQFRFLTICIVVVLAFAFAAFARLRKRTWIIAAVVVVITSMCLPFDVAMRSFHYGLRRGTSTGGPHLVEFVVGYPMHGRLIEEYGEYISGGCSGIAVFSPRWILVWD